MELTLTHAALSADEFAALKTWVAENKQALPSPIGAMIERMIALYAKLASEKKNTSDVVRTLRMAMGIIPTSERGKQLLDEKR
jgi:hypothetical protein